MTCRKTQGKITSSSDKRLDLIANSTTDNQVENYAAKPSLYDAFVQSLLALTERLFRANSIEVVSLEGRAKDIDSFRGKITREDKNYSDPLNEITDLAGVRVVTYQLADIDKVSDLIVDNFDVDKENSVDKRQIVEADRFGYLSVHYIVSLNGDRDSLPEYAPYSGLKAEFQIRTVLQHAWAAIDHKFRYKTKDEAPLNLRRRLFRISALLETADSEFETLRTEMDAVRKQYKEGVAGEQFDIPLDLESVAAYAEVASAMSQIKQAAIDAEIVVSPYHPGATRPEFATLLGLMNHFGMKSLSGLEEALQRILAGVPSLLDSIKRNWREIKTGDDPNLKLVVNRESLLRLVFPLTLNGAERESAVADSSFGKSLKLAFEKTYADLSAP
jgi:putative GTP pyrophosphokinase